MREARIIPVILRPGRGWEKVPFGDIDLGELQGLPKDAKPVTGWANRDEVWKEVVEGIEGAVSVLLVRESVLAVNPRPSILRSAVLTGMITNKSGSGTKRSGLLLLPVLALVILVIIFSVWGGIGFYLNETNRLMSQVNPTATTVANIATSQAKETATAQNFPSPTYPPYLSGSGTLAFVDPLSQEGGSKWSSFSASNGAACQFTGGAYHVSQPQKYFTSCRAGRIFSNFAFEVQLRITQGDCGGTDFRDDRQGHFYYFHICQDGGYKVAIYSSSTDFTNLRGGNSSAIHAGLGQQNKVAVVASGSTITFYVNEHQIDQVH